MSKLVIFESEDEQIKIDVNLENDSVWLTQKQMAELFGKARTTITGHINNIFGEEELKEIEVCRNFRLTTQHGGIRGKTQTIESMLTEFVTNVSEILQGQQEQVAKNVMDISDIKSSLRELKKVLDKV